LAGAKGCPNNSLVDAQLINCLGFAMRYDASRQPDPEAWLELDEAERIVLVADYHKRLREKLDNPEQHAMAHVVVENQIAQGDETTVPATLVRLMAEGLDRHDAIHAIGSVLLDILFDFVHTDDDGTEFTKKYDRELAELTARNWRSDQG